MNFSNFLKETASNVPEDTITELLHNRSLVERHDKLINLRGKLIDEIQKEKEFKNYCNGKKELTEAQNAKLEAEFNAEKDRFQAAALENAKFSRHPFIFKVKEINGNTQYVNKSRKRAKILELKTKFKENMEKLENLRNNVFCLDNETSANEYSILDENKIEASELKLSEKLKNTLNENCDAEESISVTQPTLRAINQIIDDFQNPEKLEPKVVFSQKTFTPKSTDKQRNVDFLISDYFSFYDKQNALLEEKKKNLEEVNQEIRKIDEQRSTMSQRISKNLEKHISQLKNHKYVLCVDVAYEAHKQVQQAQTVIDSLSKYMNTKDNKDVIANDATIKLLIAQISSDIKQIVDRSKRMSLTQTISPINIPTTSKFTVNEISLEHISRCKKNIEELRSIFDVSQQYQVMALDELDGMLKGIKTMCDMQQYKFHDRKKTEPTITIDFERRRKFNELRMKVLEKQKKQLAQVGEMISSLPDSIKELQVKPIEQKSADENQKGNEESHAEASNDDALIEESDPFAEANSVILERILAKEVNATEAPNLASTIPVYSPNDNAKEVFDQIANKLSVDKFDYEKSIAEKNNAQKRLTNLLDTTMTLKEKKVAALAEMEERKKRIEELQEKINALKQDEETNKAKAQELSEKERSLKEKTSKVESENRSLEENINELEEKNKEAQELEKQVQAVKDERASFNEQINKELTELKQKMDAKKQENK